MMPSLSPHAPHGTCYYEVNGRITLIASGSKGIVGEVTAQLERVNAERIEVRAKREARERLTDLPVLDHRVAEVNDLYALQHFALNWDESILK